MPSENSALLHFAKRLMSPLTKTVKQREIGVASTQFNQPNVFVWVSSHNPALLDAESSGSFCLR